MKKTTLRSLSGPADGTSFRSSRAGRTKLGELLVGTGALTAGERRDALARQARFEARFGDILVANELIDRAGLHAALARQFGCEVADLEAEPPAIALVLRLGADACLLSGIVPWKERGGRVVVASSRPEEFERHRKWLTRIFGHVTLAVTGELELHRAVSALQPAALAARAEVRVPGEYSCRDLVFNLGRVHPSVLVVVLVFAVLVLYAPLAALQVLSVWAVFSLAATTALKAGAFVAAIRADAQPPPDPENRPVLARLPRVSVLVALYDEPQIVARLVTRLGRIDYPRELLDICLIVEADDAATRDVLATLDLPQHMRPIVVPEGNLKTKPRALNYALDLCRGTLIGIYDAEDAPAPDQILKVVERFQERGPELACVQAVLDFYNSRSNWLARCFAIEYAAWFRVILPGMTRLGFVPPLGGTSLFLRRAVLDKLGGWDAHNVTEDADLGIRLARFGYRTEIIGSVTEEEANCRPWPWVRQRSRWLKGYAMTWAVHMRRPHRLWRDLGAWKFAGFQVLFLGTLSQFLLAPLLWLFWGMLIGLAHPLGSILGPVGLGALMAAFLASEAVTLAVGLYAVRDRRHRHLLAWVPTLHAYFVLAVLAAYRGTFDLLSRPFYWDKTAHGIFAPTDGDPAPPDEAVTPAPRFGRRRA